MNINDLIVNMAVRFNEEGYQGKACVTLSIEGLQNFARSFALDVLHDSDLQNQLMNEV